MGADTGHCINGSSDFVVPAVRRVAIIDLDVHHGFFFSNNFFYNFFFQLAIIDLDVHHGVFFCLLCVWGDHLVCGVWGGGEWVCNVWIHTRHTYKAYV